METEKRDKIIKSGVRLLVRRELEQVFDDDDGEMSGEEIMNKLNERILKTVADISAHELEKLIEESELDG